jgi:hypothetical protein
VGLGGTRRGYTYLKLSSAFVKFGARRGKRGGARRGYNSIKLTNSFLNKNKADDKPYELAGKNHILLYNDRSNGHIKAMSKLYSNCIGIIESHLISSSGEAKSMQPLDIIYSLHDCSKLATAYKTHIFLMGAWGLLLINFDLSATTTYYL